ncbi:MAG: M23 family metallopeptidase [Melioribacteraceae bacterium]|nr:M23 family metallopeptidase [Melioribacteraceae bacterium]
MSLFNLKELKRSSIYFTPNFPSLQTKRYKFSFFKVTGLVILYSLFVALLTTLILILTPAKEILFFVENENLTEKAEQIKEMDERIQILTKQLNAISSTNAKLKYAIMLGEVDSLDSNTQKIYDSLRESSTNKKTIPKEGFVLKAFIQFVNKFFNNDTLDADLIFIQPSKGKVINNFNETKGHLGVDYALKNDSPIFASESGHIIFSGYDINDGYTIIIAHQNNYISKYKHCAKLLVSEREFVRQGEIIAMSGNSGFNTTGPHLHFEIWKDGFALDPYKYLIVEGELNGK